MDKRTIFSDEDDSQTSSELRVLSTSPLLLWLPTTSQSDSDRTLRALDVAPLAKEFLTDRSENFLFDSSGILIKIPALLEPCAAYSLLDRCSLAKCNFQHLSPNRLNEALFKERIELVATIVELMETSLDAASGTTEENVERQREKE